jgi:predicted O-methyltransferase YrrM
MADPSLLDDQRICFGELEIMLLHGNSAAELMPRDDVYFMMKSKPYIAGYQDIRHALTRSTWAASTGNVLEIGVLRGGSAPFLHHFFDAKRLVCVDILQHVVPLERYKAQTGDVLRTHYGIDQSDRPKLREIIEADFNGPIDLVVDDASHLYEHSKASFEAVFPYLRPGGAYVVEDWSWSHERDAQVPGHYYADRHALTNLVFEFTCAYGWPSGLIESIGFSAGLMWVIRGWKQLARDDFHLDDYLHLRGRALQLV